MFGPASVYCYSVCIGNSNRHGISLDMDRRWNMSFSIFFEGIQEDFLLAVLRLFLMELAALGSPFSPFLALFCCFIFRKRIRLL